MRKLRLGSASPFQLLISDHKPNYIPPNHLWLDLDAWETVKRKVLEERDSEVGLFRSRADSCVVIDKDTLDVYVESVRYTQIPFDDERAVKAQEEYLPIQAKDKPWLAATENDLWELEIKDSILPPEAYSPPEVYRFNGCFFIPVNSPQRISFDKTSPNIKGGVKIWPKEKEV